MREKMLEVAKALRTKSPLDVETMTPSAVLHFIADTIEDVLQASPQRETVTCSECGAKAIIEDGKVILSQPHSGHGCRTDR